MKNIPKIETLKLIAKRSDEGKETSYRSLAKEFGLSDEAACGRLKRLWNERLIECTTYRLSGSEFRLSRGESIRGLRFQVTRRGGDRLRWYAEQARRKTEEEWWR